MNTPDIAIRTSSLRKEYGDHVVLAGLDLEVSTGSVFALLGPNGAGKTTVVHILSTLLASDGGVAEVWGHDVARNPDAVRAAIGLTGQFSAVDRLLTGRENLQLMADLRHMGKHDGPRRVNELLEQFDLVEAADQQLATYSGGMKRRLDLAMTLVEEPRIIFLDEPTTGLDPRSRHMMWNVIRDLARGGVTIFLTTQYLEEADHLADRMALLDKGVLVASGTSTELKRLVPGTHVTLEFADPSAMEAAARLLAEATCDAEGLTLRLPSDGSVRSLRETLARLDETIEVSDLSINTPSLDDVFFALTGGDNTKENRP